MKIVDILNEGIHDKGIFKCLFLGGIPASGKSTLVNQAKHVCDVQPKVLDFDQFYEYLSKKHDIPISTNVDTESSTGKQLRAKAKHLTTAQLNLYLSGMLPLIVDTTASSIAQLIERMSIVRNHGYDIMMVYKTVELDTALDRAKQRTRYVDQKHIKQMHTTEGVRLNEIKNYLAEKDSDFIVVAEASDALKITNKFFNSPVKNPIGIKQIQQLKQTNQKIVAVSDYAKQWY
jgi:predicted kinase